MSNHLHVPVQHRLERPTTERRVGGVCSGIAEYFGIDPIITRVGFLFLIITGGIGFVAYPLLWLIMPSADQQRASWGRNFAEIRAWIANLFATVMNKIRSPKKQARFDPITGQPINTPRPRFDPITGEPINDIPVNNVPVKQSLNPVQKRRALGVFLIGALALLSLPVIAELSGLLFAMLIIGGGIYLLRRSN